VNLDRTPRRRRAEDVPIALAMLAPWLSPFAAGPSTSVVPWLVGAMCASALALLTRASPGRVFLSAALMVLPFAAWRAVSPLEPAAFGGALAVIALAMGVGAWSQQEGRVELVARVWWIAAAASTALALVQYFGVSSALAPWVSPTEAGTAYANLRQRNQFATLTAIGLAALLWESRRGGRAWPWAALAAWLSVGNAASLSRTGAVELLALVALSVLWRGRSRAQAIVASSALAAYVVAVFALPLLLSLAGASGVSLLDRVAGPDACGSRSVLWSNVAHLIALQPLTGWGWGELDFAHYATLYPGPRFCDILDNAHDLPLHLAVELGLPFAVLVCAAAGVAVLRARPWKEANTDRQLAWSVAAAIAMHSLLEYPLWYAPFQIAFGLALGMLWPRDARLPATAARAAPAIFAVIVAYAAWDYTRVSQIYLAPEQRIAQWREDPLPAVQRSWLFREYAVFAELTITPLTRENAASQYTTALEMLHYSPEPRIVEKIIESATMLGHTDVAAEHLARFRAAFPKEHAAWAQGHGSEDAKD
jgi:O-antigen ligase